MGQIEGIIFDCDGVLFESRDANLAYYNRILEKFSYPLVTNEQPQRAHLCHTASSPDVLAVLLDSDDIQPALDYAATLDYRDFIPQMRPEPYLEVMLRDLSKHYPLAVATNRGTSIEPVLSHFGFESFFKVIVTSRDVARPKPAPDMLLLASQRLGYKAQHCLFIGDSELDLRAATAASIPFVGYGGIVGGKIDIESHLELLDFCHGVNNGTQGGRSVLSES